MRTQRRVAPPQPWQPPVTERRTWPDPWQRVVVPVADVAMGTVEPPNQMTEAGAERRLAGFVGDVGGGEGTRGGLRVEGDEGALGVIEARVGGG